MKLSLKKAFKDLTEKSAQKSLKDIHVIQGGVWGYKGLPVLLPEEVHAYHSYKLVRDENDPQKWSLVYSWVDNQNLDSHRKIIEEGMNIWDGVEKLRKETNALPELNTKVPQQEMGYVYYNNGEHADEHGLPAVEKKLGLDRVSKEEPREPKKECHSLTGFFIKGLNYDA